MTVNTGPLQLCGTGVLAGAGTLVGQGTSYLLNLLYTTDTFDDPTPVWVDATSDLRTFETSRGRATELDEVEAGQATFRLNNRSRTYDPVSNGLIRPRNRWWLREQFNGLTNDVFYGYAESYEQTWPSMTDAEAVVHCSDEFQVLARSRVPTMDPPRNTYAELVGFDNPTNYWRWSDSNLTSTDVAQTTEMPTFHWTYNGFEWDTVTITGTVSGFQDWTSVGGVGFQSGYDSSPVVGDLQGITAGLGGWLDMSSTGPASIVANNISVGDPMGGTAFTFETWFMKSGNPGSLQTFVYGPESTTAGARTWYAQLTTTGAITFGITDSGGTARTVTSVTNLNSNVWYHLMCHVSGTNLRVYINGAIDNAVSAGAGAIRATNTATGLPMQIAGMAGVTDTYMDETCCYLNVAMTAARALAHYQAGALRGYRGGNTLGLSHLRAIDVLDSVSSHAPRNLRVGARGLLPAFQAGQDPLTELKKCALAELPEGNVFVSRGGAVTLLDAAHKTVSPWNTVQLVFDDDGTDLPYRDMTLDYSDSFLVNQWDLQATGGVLDSSSDATSISRYGNYPRSLTDLPITSSLVAIGDALLAKYKEPQARILTLKPQMNDVNVLDGVMQRELGDKIEVWRSPPGGGRIDEQLWIESIQITGSPGVPLDVTFGLGNPLTGGASAG